MNIANPMLNDLGSFLAPAMLKDRMGTLDCNIVYHDRTIDPILLKCRRDRLYVFWHDYLLLPLYLRWHCDLAMLLSRHRDAEILSRLADRFGFDCIRGSSNRDGAAAVRAMLSKSRTMHLTITPDGPRGPRRHLAPGCIYLASKQRLPLVVMGFGYDRPWRIGTAWDQSAGPRCYSRARAITSREIFVPSDLKRHGLERFRWEIEEQLNRLTAEAEAWAESGSGKTGQERFICHRPRGWRMCRRTDIPLKQANAILAEAGLCGGDAARRGSANRGDSGIGNRKGGLQDATEVGGGTCKIQTVKRPRHSRDQETDHAMRKEFAVRNKPCLRWIAIVTVLLTGCATARQNPASRLPPGFGAERVSALRLDAGLPESLSDGAKQLVPHALIVEGHGTTECSPVVAANRPEEITRTSVSCRNRGGDVGWGVRH